MLIAFSVGNFLSFKETVTLNMTASSISENEDNTFEEFFGFDKKTKLLKSAVIYGANASGKSNLIKAMSFMKNLIINSSKESQSGEKIEVYPFKFDKKTEKEPSFFEIEFIYNKNKYKYGFVVDSEKVHKEWLFCLFDGKKTNVELFHRDNNEIKIHNKFVEADKLAEKTRANALFLSVVANFNGHISTQIIEWIKKYFIVTSGLNYDEFLNYTMREFENEKLKKEILNLMKLADLDIENIEFEKIDIDLDKVPLEFKKDEKILELIKNRKTINTIHKQYENNKEVGQTRLEFGHESKGTQKYISFLGPIIEVLNEGKILVIDELDASLHPKLTRLFIEIFHNTKINKKNAQLIFNCHDTNLLNSEYFRRDEIWFTEKNKYGATDLYSLVEFKFGDKKIRNDEVYGKNYISGKYGAIPFIGNFEFLMEE
jgi:uncharacterized protein